ncbi:MAG TPA: hypothetical protein VFG30_09235 [Polyangiales bacterium]|jgi:hypothetical protein|nr:hypothetical protein [Polyangiales bacterium]
MANPVEKTPPHPPRFVRLPPHAAQGLDEEITAQPRPLSDDVGLTDLDEGLSVDSDDLGSHYLSAATEGDSAPQSATEIELSIVSGPQSDDVVLRPPNFEFENTLWEQTVDVMQQTQGASDQLRAPSVVEDTIDPLELKEEAEDLQRLDEHSLHDLSLLDRVSDETRDDETIEPDLDSEELLKQAIADEHVQHAPLTPPIVLDEKMEENIAREQAGAGSSDDVSPLPRRAARAALRNLASVLRRFSELGGRTY